jgi:hypothetical protein
MCFHRLTSKSAAIIAGLCLHILHLRIHVGHIPHAMTECSWESFGDEADEAWFVWVRHLFLIFKIGPFAEYSYSQVVGVSCSCQLPSFKRCLFWHGLKCAAQMVLAKFVPRMPLSLSGAQV